MVTARHGSHKVYLSYVAILIQSDPLGSGSFTIEFMVCRRSYRISKCMGILESGLGQADSCFIIIIIIIILIIIIIIVIIRKSNRGTVS